LTKEAWFQASLDAAKKEFTQCFHWELEFPEVYFEGTVRRANPGFDAVIGNPPYDVLSEREIGRDLTAFKAFIEAEPVYDASRRGKNNLYKLFICRALELLREGGYFGFITPMAVLGDDQAADIRRKIVEQGSFTGIESFPQKDNPARRVFPEAKLSTAVFTVERTHGAESDVRNFVSRVHPAQWIEEDSPSLTLSTASIPLYDPSNFTIVSCAQSDWDLATRIIRTGRLGRLRDYCESFQGEVNETNENRRNALSRIEGERPLVLRGSNICLYAVREASQGEPLYLLEEAFFEGKSPNSKAYHSQQVRAGFQRSSPQNNFRRIVATMIGAGNFCFDTVSYIPASETSLPLEFIVGLLNSKLLDWYFRLGSTNSKVNEYQFNNLPCPIFRAGTDRDEEIEEAIRRVIRTGNAEEVFQSVAPAIQEPPFGREALYAVVHLVSTIGRIERERGEIRRVARSALDPAAQPYQDLIDRLLYAMAGLTNDEAAMLEERLAVML